MAGGSAGEAAFAGAGASVAPGRAGAGAFGTGVKAGTGAGGFGTRVKVGTGAGAGTGAGSTSTRAGDFSEASGAGVVAGFLAGTLSCTLGVCSAPSRIAAATGGLGSREAALPPAIAGFAAARGFSAIPILGAGVFGA